MLSRCTFQILGCGAPVHLRGFRTCWQMKKLKLVSLALLYFWHYYLIKCLKACMVISTFTLEHISMISLWTAVNKLICSSIELLDWDWRNGLFSKLRTHKNTSLLDYFNAFSLNWDFENFTCLSSENRSIHQPAEEINISSCEPTNHFFNSSLAESKADVQCKLLDGLARGSFYWNTIINTLWSLQTELGLADMIYYFPSPCHFREALLYFPVLISSLALLAIAFNSLYKSTVVCLPTFLIYLIHYLSFILLT